MVGLGVFVFFSDPTVEEPLSVLVGELGVENIRHRPLYIVFEPLQIYASPDGIDNDVGSPGFPASRLSHRADADNSLVVVFGRRRE